MLLFILVRSFIQTDDRTAVWLAVVFRYRAEPTRTLPETYFILGSGRWLAYNFLPQPAWQSRLFHSINTRPWRPVDRTEYRSGIWDYLSDCRAGVRWFTALMCLSEPRFYFEIRFWWYLGKFWPGWWRARESTWLFTSRDGFEMMGHVWRHVACFPWPPHGLSVLSRFAAGTDARLRYSSEPLTCRVKLVVISGLLWSQVLRRGRLQWEKNADHHACFTSALFPTAEDQSC